MKLVACFQKIEGHNKTPFCAIKLGEHHIKTKKHEKIRINRGAISEDSAIVGKSEDYKTLVQEVTDSVRRKRPRNRKNKNSS